MDCLFCVELSTAHSSKLISELREWKVCVTWTPLLFRDRLCRVLWWWHTLTCRVCMLWLWGTACMAGCRLVFWLNCTCFRLSSLPSWVTGVWRHWNALFGIFTLSDLKKAFFHPTVWRYSLPVFWLLAFYHGGSRSLVKVAKKSLNACCCSYVYAQQSECDLGNWWFLNSNVLPRCLRTLYFKHPEFWKT